MVELSTTQKVPINRKRILTFLILIIAVFLSMLLLNTRTPFTSDDYRYHYFYNEYKPQDTTRLLTGIRDIPGSMRNHYNTWGGRIVAHTIVQFFLLFDKHIFNIFNSLIYVLLGLLMYAHVDIQWKKWKPGVLLFLYLSMWIFIPQYGLSVLWVSGSCNYLWMITLILAYTLPFSAYTQTKENSKKWLMIILMFLGGFIAGCSNENGGGAMIALILLYILYWVYNKIKVPLWSVAGLISSSIGFLSLIKAPGNKGRNSSDILDLDAMLGRVDTVWNLSKEYLFTLLIFFMVLAILIVLTCSLDFKQSIGILLRPSMYCITGIASIVVMIASPTVAGRSWIISVCFLLISNAIFIHGLNDTNWIIPFSKKFILLTFLIIGMLSYKTAVLDITKTYNEVQSQINTIKEQKQDDILDVVVNAHTKSTNPYNALNGTSYLSQDPNSWFNSWMALFYEVDSISLGKNKGE